MTVIGKAAAVLAGAQLLASAAVLLILDLNAYNHMSGDFSWPVFMKSVIGTLPFYLALAGSFLILAGGLIPVRKKKRISVQDREHSLK
ncbi:hypothetical protein AXI59_05500 [Bacillus nakamurai]|uniref:Uncharacterized protein n=1 Tax=Bacillus nakamurai TaxID=1793963 RepID=A0A150F5N9_9BACI|nr:hypothetical protein [Bacillus nakamurai]KXZ13340.1 hypothetical protein AXI59_05500 [Bacillus nakamurai]KXZ17535.1 hypothetical protein AXI58_19080 [Bacillus nakamurai]MCC9023782.1 hypothetical protein [Bacillus nakamurai]MCP6682403.1 hypothetical protein [Bacillus nakamurai]MED1227182.1 hypothetical protein [Bacillus nakamurai]